MQAAIEYAERFHWSVIPLSPGSKIPPKGFKVRPYRERIATRDEIEGWWKKEPAYNLGIITGKLSGILGIDHDIYKPGYSEAEALRYIPDDVFTPTSETARGGQHQLFVYPEENITIGAELIPGLDYRGEGGHIVAPPSVGDNGKSYRWLIEPAEVEPARLPRVLLDALIKKDTPYIEGCRQSVDTTANYFTPGRRNEDLFTTAFALVKQKLSESFIRQAVENIAKNCRPPLPSNEVETILQSAFERGNRSERNLSEDVRELVLSTSGNFLSTEVYSCLQLSTRDERKNVSIILKRLCDEGIIERYGQKNGCFRRVENEVEALDWRNADTRPMSISWPFGLERLVNIYPGNVIVIAGSPNSGKTAFLLNFTKLNQDKHEIHLFSSEGGPEELKLRLSKFDCPLETWQFKAWERSGDFADVIRPGAINLIDYLEIHDDFYKIGGTLKAISEKLKGGLAVIALQKNKGREEGLGGFRSLEKPRLYLSMDSGLLKIVKAKAWVDSAYNPNGLEIEWKLVDGCKFQTTSSWR